MFHGKDLPKGTENSIKNFPDLDLATCGDTIEESMAMDCLAGRLRWLKRDGDPIPKPSPMSAIDPTMISKELEIEPSEAFVNMVSVDVEAYAKEHLILSSLSIKSLVICGMSESYLQDL